MRDVLTGMFLKDDRGDLKKIQNDFYFCQGLPQGPRFISTRALVKLKTVIKQ